MSSNPAFMNILYKLNFVRYQAEKEREIYKMKYLSTLRELQKSQQIVYLLKNQSENKFMQKLNESWKSFMKENLKDKINEIQKLEEQNRNLIEEINNLKKIDTTTLTLSQIKSLKPQNTNNIFIASEMGDLEEIKYWLSLPPKNLDGNTPVHIAAKRNYVNIIQYFSENNFDIDTKNDDGLTPLHIACVYNCLNCVKFLFEKGVNINCRSLNEETPLHLAAFEGNEEVVDFLLNNGANVNSLNLYNNTPLHKASIGGSLPVVKKLLEKGADINAKGYQDMTPLEKAYFNKKTSVMDFLASKGANF